MEKDLQEIKDFLDYKAELYERQEFMLQLMEYDPYNFILNASDSVLDVFKTLTQLNKIDTHSV